MRSAFLVALVWAVVFLLAVMGVASMLGDSMADDDLQHRAVMEGVMYR